MRKKAKYIVLSFILLFLLAIVGGGYWFWDSSKPVNTNPDEKKIVVKKGASAMQVANILESQGLIKNSLAFKIYIQLTGRSQSIKSGEYTIASNKTMKEVVSEILKGPKLVWVTIPEGLRVEQVAQKFADSLNLDNTPKSDFINSFIENGKDYEGHLFPDTYLVPKDITALKAVNLMRTTFDQKIKDLKVTNKDLSFEEIVVLASLVERETKTKEERPIVAGIIMNRLQSDWPLQIDAAVQYGIANINCKGKVSDCDFWKTLTKEDLEVNSPYNTYKNSGLPPKAIASAGLSSLTASFSPVKTDYWFYLHDENGKIHYAKTLDEHNRNVKKYLGK